MFTFKEYLIEDKSLRRPRIIIKAKKPEGFVKYSTLKELPGHLKEHFKDSTVSLKSITELFAHHNIALRDSEQLMVPTEQLIHYREFDRKVVDNWTGKMSGEEREELKQNIKEKGFDKTQYLMLTIIREPDRVEVYLGEGNHRLSIARELNIKKLPLKFHYIK